MSISLAPNKKRVPVEKLIDKIINKGGKPANESPPPVENPDGLKSLKLVLSVAEIDAIKTIRDKRPKQGRRKISISIHDWIIEAVQEKIEREKYF